MLKKNLLGLGMALILATSSATSVYADQTDTAATVMENCGAYLFEWRPIDCGNGYYSAILVGGDIIQESNVILNRGYDCAYTLGYMAGRPRGQTPDPVNANGVWAIPEDQPSLPEGTQPVLHITLVTNNKVPPSRERYIDVVSLPGGANPGDPPPEVRKYLVNMDGSDAGAYVGTVIPGQRQDEDGRYRYLKPDGTYISNGWLKVSDQQYYMDENGIMPADAITPDEYYANPNGEKTSYYPGWVQNDKGWRHVGKNGYYATSTWVRDTDGRQHYSNIAAYMETDSITSDSYYVDANGVWDGNPSTKMEQDNKSLGLGVVNQ